MRGADGQAEVVSDHDGAHGHSFGGCSLRVGEVVLADFFTHCFYDAFVADHGAESECEGHGIFHPVGNVICELFGMTRHVLLAFLDLGIHVQLAGFVQFGDGF